MRDNFNRRKFLEYSFFTSAALLAGPKRLARAGALDGIKVVVIGAGCSGLGAARTLADSGANVTVVEAKSNIGGRLLTDWSMGAPFEVGAGWIHGPENDNPTRKLADTVGSQYVVTDDDNLEVFNSSGESLSEEDLEELFEDWENEIERLDNNLEDNDKSSLREAMGNVGFHRVFKRRSNGKSICLTTRR